MDVRLPDGTIIKDVPEGTTKAQLAEKLQRNGMAVPAEWLTQKTEEPAAVQAGKALNSIPRQLGLTARYAIEGPAQLAQIATEPIRRLVTDPLLGVKTKPLSEQASGLADRLGLPSPEGANERVAADAARLVAGAGGAGLAGGAARGLGGLAEKIGGFFAANPVQQLSSAAGAGLAGGAAREAGGGPWQQAGAAMLGGLAAPAAVNVGASVARKVSGIGKNIAEYVAPGSVKTTDVDQQINLILRQQGIDWSAIPERIKQPMRAEVASALSTGGKLNPAAVRRLLDFQTVGATPTRGMLTQDPVQLTREKNLAKVGANSTDIGLQRLPRLENENTAALLRNLDEAGAANAPDSFATGQRVLDALNRDITASRGRIGALYSAARDTSGRSAPLDGAAFTSRANALLDERLVGGKLPTDVAAHMNRIAKGEVPFTVDYAEQLKTRIGDLQRASRDGQERLALGLVRQALDDTPLQSAPRVNPGNLAAVQGTVPPSPAVLGEESIAAFNRARQANRAFMQRVEQTPALQAALDDAQPDRFVQQFIIGQGATVKDVQALRRSVAADPQALQAIKQNILAHLRSAATNGTEDITKFSPASYNRALNNIGERKLSAFFDAEEVRRLQAIGRTGTLMTAQPAGTAVNNSNTGALVLGRAMDVLDTIAGKLPLGADTMIQGTLRGFRQGRALNVPGSLLQPPEQLPMLTRLGTPAIYGGLLASQPVQ